MSQTTHDPTIESDEPELDPLRFEARDAGGIDFDDLDDYDDAAVRARHSRGDDT